MESLLSRRLFCSVSIPGLLACELRSQESSLCHEPGSPILDLFKGLYAGLGGGIPHCWGILEDWTGEGGVAGCFDWFCTFPEVALDET